MSPHSPQNRSSSGQHSPNRSSNGRLSKNASKKQVQRSRSLSPTKKPRSWRPDKPFDSTNSVSERTTTIYSAMQDKHLYPKYRKSCGNLENKSSKYASLRDKQEETLHKKKQVVEEQRKIQLERLQEFRPELYERTWELQHEQRAYYPSTLSAGGAELCPIKRKQQINPPKDVVDNQSLLAHPFWASMGSSSNLRSSSFRFSQSHGSSNSYQPPTRAASMGRSVLTDDTTLSVALRKNLCSPHQVTVDI
eukprot:CAMPEP_0114256374 /NCGR_PEP_ID=MMETSP0058-20121206/18114_1 /TAXON_ID=36894 /ORGANISM="Pyramimonas parkeae, CCMP726" /LENGTH=248 /DNA_ID=CAMNT_0001370927 /DNA_START=57 /DNA_END=803 /DNA_ORIENTATION=-